MLTATNTTAQSPVAMLGGSIRRASMTGLSFAVAVDFTVDGVIMRGETLELREGSVIVTSAAAKRTETRTGVRRIEVPGSVHTIPRLDTVDGVIIRQCTEVGCFECATIHTCMQVKTARGVCAFFHVKGNVLNCAGIETGNLTVGRAGEITTVSGNIFSGASTTANPSVVRAALLPHQVELFAPGAEITHLQMRESDATRANGHAGGGAFVTTTAGDTHFHHCSDYTVYGTALFVATLSGRVRVVSGCASVAKSLSGDIVLETCPFGKVASQTGRVFVRTMVVPSAFVEVLNPNKRKTACTTTAAAASKKTSAAAKKRSATPKGNTTKTAASKSSTTKKGKTTTSGTRIHKGSALLAICPPPPPSSSTLGAAPKPVAAVSRRPTPKAHFEIELVD